MELNLAKTVVGYLKAHPDEKFTARQIADWVFATYPEQCQAKKQSSLRLETDAELVQQIVREISSQLPRLQREHLELKTTEGGRVSITTQSRQTVPRWLRSRATGWRQ